MKVLNGVTIFSAVFVALIAQGKFPVVDDGNTVILNQSVDISGSDVYIGFTTSGNGLVQDPNVGLVADNGYIGYGAATSFNWMSLRPGAAAVFNANLWVGYNGSSSNALYVGSNSAVGSSYGSLGAGVGADRNLVSVNGSGARWDVLNDIYIGEAGSENTLEIKNGGAVSAAQFLIGALSTAGTNAVELSAGVLEVGAFAVGSYGSSNTMNVANGSAVSAVDAWVGFTNTANGNVLTVSDSELQLSGTLTVGSDLNTGNRVEADSGADITVDGLDLQGVGNEFNLNSGATLTVNSDLDASMSGFNFNDGSALGVKGDLTGLADLEDGKMLGVYGTWDMSGSNVTVGGASDDNAVLIAEGGQASVQNFMLGTASNSFNNSVRISGEGSLLTIKDQLTIGSLLSSNQTVTVENGGKVILGGDLLIDGDNAFELGSDGWLTVSNDFNAPAGLDFQAGATFEAMGDLTGMSASVESNRSVLLTGPAAEWNVSSDAFIVADSLVALTNGARLVSSSVDLVSNARINVDGSEWNNSGLLVVGSMDGSVVTVTNGGQVMTTDTQLGVGNDNQIIISGSGSVWDNLNDFQLGAGGTDNMLQIEQGGQLDVGQLLSLNDGAALDLKTDGVVTAGSFYQDASSSIQFDSLTNVAIDPGAALIQVGGTAELTNGASIIYTGSIGAVDVGVTNSRKIISSNLLVADLDALIGGGSEGLFSTRFFAQNNDLYYQLFRQSLAESAGFESNSQMYAISDEIDQLANDGDQVAINQLDILDDLTGEQQNTQLTQLYEQTAPTYAHMDGLFEGMRQVKNRGVMPDSMWPVGARGPHLYGSQAQFWMKGYGTWASRDGEGANSSYDQSIFGVVVGYDKAFGDYLVGVAGGYSSSDISQDNDDSSKAGTGYGVLYSSWGTSDWFADGSVALGLGSVENDSGTVFDTSSDTDASQFAYNLSGGKELAFMEGRMFLTPSAGLLGGWYSQGAYTEKSSNAVAKQIDSYSRWSFQSELGVKASYHKELKKNVLMPEVHANWLHQFNNDADQLGYTLVGGTGNYNLDMQAPVSDLFELGLGLSLWTESKKGTVSEWVLGFDSRFGDGYSATSFNARMVFEF